jgi:hypothetical protein
LLLAVVTRYRWFAVKGWNLIKPLLPPATQAKVQILGAGDFLPLLDEYVERDQLPSFLGGAETAFAVEPFYTETDLFYQDRLGTDVGKAEGQGVFCRRG